jgi:hypothetical protein
MMRRVLDQMIWLHGTYRFENRELMYRTIVDARQVLEMNPARLPRSLKTAVVGNELVVVAQLPMFEDYESTTGMFSLLARASQRSLLEARVDVL